MDQEPYLEEESKDVACKKDCKSIAASLLVYNLLLIAAGLIIGMVSGAFMIKGASATDIEIIINILSMICSSLMILFTVGMFKKRLKVKLPFTMSNDWNFLTILYYTIIGMGLSCAAGFVIQLVNQFLTDFGVTMTTPDFSMTTDFTYNLIIVLSACVIAPIFEELLFRGLILQTLKRHGNVFAIVVTSLLFAMMHGNLPQAVPVFALSLVISYAVIKTGSILPGIAIHFLNNSFAMIEGSFLVDDQISTIFIIIEVLCMLYAFFMLYQKRIAIHNYIIHNKGYRIRVFFGNWMSILFLIFCIVAIISSFKIL
ncbi:CPBP family intramembrane metalloprotease [[Clostridium] innocuum]|nr:CPBP family intramembrane metalloprotease [[Clostridium] innocuum]